MKYHEYINIRHYRLAKHKGLTSRDEPYGGETFDDVYKRCVFSRRRNRSCLSES